MFLPLLVAGSAIGGPFALAVPPADKPIAALHEMMRAVNAGDARAYARVYAEDAVITIHGGGVLRGRPAIEAYEVELLREFPGVRLAFYDVWRDGPSAVVHYGVNGRTPGGQAMGHEGLLFYRFDSSGLVAEERRYLDSVTPMAQLGALGSSPARPLPVLPDAMTAHAGKRSSNDERNEALVRASFAALDAEDETAFLAGLAEDAVLDDMTEPRPSIGRQGVKAWFDRWTSAVEGGRTELTTVVAVGDTVLVETVVRGRLKGPLGRLAPSTREFAVHRAAIVQVKDGKVRRLSAFMNGKELAQAVGQWPPTAGK
jgi:uncharacterized protein (TIGR02246 family)